MPRRRTSIKRTRQDKKKHLRNLRVKKELKKAIKQFNSLVSAKNMAEAKKLISKVFSKLDKAAKKMVIHPATANRRKSRLARKIAKGA
jgi:small subunit ribosomal protein S20